MPPSLREALSDAIETEEVKDTTPAATVTPEVAESPAPDIAAASDTSADATPAPTETPAAEAAPTEPIADQSAVELKPDAAKAAENARQHRIDRAPSSWKKEAKGEWAALPVHIRQEVHKREAEINRVLQQSAPDRQLAEQFKQTVTPYLGMVKARGLDPLQATANLFEADMKLSTGPAQGRAAYLAELIMNYGIDVKELDTALSSMMSGAPQAQGAPDIAAIVQQQLSQALAPIMQERQKAQQRSQNEVEQTVEQMSLDPKYPFFEDVREDMADLIDLSARKGIPLSLDEAYNRAVRMNPDTYGQLERTVTVSNATQAHQAAIRAKAAGSSISGAPAGGGGQFNGGDGSLRGAIEAAFGGQRL